MTDASHRPSTRPTKADRVAVIVNGNAKQVTDELVQTLDQLVQSGDLYVSRSLEEGRDIARTIVDREYRTVLTGGGDGTFMQMVSWITQEADAQQKAWPRFGFLRLGTGNALAWVLGAQNTKGKGVIADLARIRADTGSRKLRLLEVGGGLSAFAGLGVDSISLEHHEQTKEWMLRTPLVRKFATASVTYAASITTRSVPRFLTQKHPHVRIVNEGGDAIHMGPDDRPGRTFEKGEVIYDGPSQMVSASTIPYWGFGARVFPFANEREDRFHLRMADVDSMEVVRNWAGFWKGTYRSPNILDVLVDRVSIHYDTPMPLQIGGDLAGMHKRVEMALASRPIDVVDFYAPPRL